MMMPQPCLSVLAAGALPQAASVGEGGNAAAIDFIVFSRRFLVLAFVPCRGA